MTPRKLAGTGAAALALLIALCSAGAAAWRADAPVAPHVEPAQVAAAPAQAPVRPALIPARAFAQPDALLSPVISPHGTRLLAVESTAGKDSLVVHGLADGATTLLPLPPNSEVEWWDWAGENRVLLSVGLTVHVDGADQFATRLFVYDLATQGMHALGEKQAGLTGDDVLYVDPAGGWLVMSLQMTARDYPGVYRVELPDGRRKLLVRPRADVWDWYTDDTGAVRLGVGERNGRTFMLYRHAADDGFRRLQGPAGAADSMATLDSFALTAGSDAGFVLSGDTGRYALYRYDFAKPALGALVFAHPQNDLTTYYLDTDQKSVVGVEFTDDRDRTVWLDPVLKSRQAALEARFPGQAVDIVSLSEARDRFVVWAGVPGQPGAYWIYSLATDQLQRIAGVNDALDESLLARTQYTHYPARDGVDIPAYLTLPPGREPRGLPLVIVPHGGPYGVRDALVYDAEVQFLANRGYVVLQPNFRGSTGYGENFEALGDGEWGRAMQDDLDDGMDWLVRQGIVDARRVCMMGGSYGGYAALWAATRNPERYRCAASMAGVTDVARQLQYQVGSSPGREGKSWRTQVKGDDDFDLAAISPLQQVAALKVPVLVVHGDADKVVLPRQSSLYKAALAQHGKVFEYHSYAGEGHGLADPAHLQDWLERLEAFLKKYNPAD